MKYYIVVIFSVLSAAGAQMLLKKGAKSHYDSFIRQYLNVWVMSGYAIMFLCMVINVYSMHKGIMMKELSIIESLSYLFVPTFSFLFFDERLSWKKMGAIAVIIIGIIIFFS